MIKYTFLAFFLLFFTVNSLSQKTIFGGMLVENFDSLLVSTQKTLLRYDSLFLTKKEDTNKLAVLGEVLYMVTKKELQTKISHHSIGFVDENLKEKKSSHELLFLKSYKNFFQINIAADYLSNSNFPKSIEWFSDALELAEENKDSGYIATIYKHFGDLYVAQGDDQASLKSYFEALKIAKKAKADNMIGDIYSSISQLHNDNGNSPDAILYEKKALNHNLTTVYLDKVVASCYNLGEFYLRQENKDSAFYYFTKSIEYSEKESNINEIMKYHIRYMRNNSKLGLLRLSNDLVESEKMCKEVLENAEKLGLNNNIAVALKYLYQINQSLGNYKQALAYRNREIEVRNKIKKEKNIQSVSDLKANLKYESQIELNEEKNRNLEQESNLKSNIIYLSVGSLLLIGLFSIFLILNRRKLNQNKLRLEELDKVNKQIFSVIAHDFKEPIINFNSLLGHISKKETLDGEFVNELESQVKSSSDVLNNLLNWARVELEKQEVNKKKLNLKQLWDKVVANMETSIKKKGLVIKNLMTENDSIEGDAVMMEIVFRNLLSNAVKFSPEGGEITLKKNNDTIEIIDQGIGMKVSSQESLFKEKVNPGYGTNGEIGFGIGLFIVKNLLGKNGKTISFSANNPNGTIFAIQES